MIKTGDNSLKARLARIKDSKVQTSISVPSIEPQKITEPEKSKASKPGPEWQEVGDAVFEKREDIILPVQFLPSQKTPSKLDPDFLSWVWRNTDCAPDPSDIQTDSLLFFDLETTGLSTGAGDIAFLAGLARLEIHQGISKIHISQILLGDYYGEEDFLNCILNKLALDSSALVSFNGRRFDTPLLRSRCIMQGLRPPMYRELDLIYPARRLFSDSLASCSQISLERSLLNLQRKDDLPGSFAPDAWLNYVKTGNAQLLLEVATHNALDLLGMSLLLFKLNSFFIDHQNLLGPWPKTAHRLASVYRELEKQGGKTMGSEKKEQYTKNQLSLLVLGSAYHLPSRLLLARHYRQHKKLKRAYEMLIWLYEDTDFLSLPKSLRAISLRALSILAFKLNNIQIAIACTEQEIPLQKANSLELLRAQRRLKRYKAFLIVHSRKSVILTKIEGNKKIE